MNYFNFLNLMALLVFILVSPINFVEADSKVESNKEMKKMTSGEHDHKGHGHKDHDHGEQKASLQKQGKEKLLIKVKGMVCSFCAQGIKKNFNAREEVAETEVNLDKMEVLIKLKKGKSLSEKVIKGLVTDAGFKYEGMTDE